MSNGQKNIVLIGFMGTGKSTVGRELKRVLHAELIDMDSEIERLAGKKIHEIFAVDGEEAFRELETSLLTELLIPQNRQLIISSGGGVVLREKNRQLLQQLGYVVWLKATPDVIHDRTKSTKTRPILRTENPQQVIRELLTERTPLYQAVADLEIEVNGLDKHEIAVGIIESMRYEMAKSH